MGVQVNELIMTNTGESLKTKAPHLREFIDLEFRGTNIGSLGFVVACEGDRYNLFGSAPIDNQTSQVNGLSGQYYWGTTYKPYEKTYSFATDGVTEQQLEKLRMLLRPGNYGKLEELEWYGRYSYARVSTQVEFNFIPFEKVETFQVPGNEKPTLFKVNEYKGEAKVTFVMDFPFFVSDDSYYGSFDDFSNDDLQDALRNMFRNGIPVYDDSIKVYGNSEANALDSNSVSFYNSSTVDSACKIGIRVPIATNENGYVTTFGRDTYPDSKDMNGIQLRTEKQDGTLLGNCKITAPTFYYELNYLINLLKSQSFTPVELEEKVRETITDIDLCEKVADFITKWNIGQATSTTANDSQEVKEIDTAGLLNELKDPSFIGTDVQFLLDGVLHTATCQICNITREKSEEGQDKIVKNILIREKQCDDIMLTPYLKLDGGDAPDFTKGGVPQSHHLLQINNGVITSLEYKYTYI